MSLPVQSNCDMSKPDEMALWALINIGDSIGAPLLVPEPILREWSRHLYMAGFRHCDDKQRIWYHPPTGADSVFSGAGGAWKDTPPSDDDLDKVLDSMSESDREALRKRLEERGRA